VTCGATCVGGGQCCAGADCGAGDWQCIGNRCVCGGAACGGTCYGSGECCTDDACGGGDWVCADHRCTCAGVTCAGNCYAGGECCAGSDCGPGVFACADHRCGCPGVVCGGTCYGGDCCAAADCGGGDWQCLDHGCSCPGLTCGSTCYAGGECCAAADCGGGDWSCAVPSCSCPRTICGSTCCQSAAHVSAYACSGATCTISTCSGTWFDVNATYSDGCECAEDTYDGNHTCATAVNLGSVATGGSVTVSGKIIPGTANDDDWYRVDFPAAGRPGGGTPRIRLTTGAATFTLELRAGSCSASPPVCGSGGSGAATSDYSFVDNQALPGAAAYSVNTTPWPSTIYIHVTRSAPATTCGQADYTIAITR
jgi:hypothetical protein